MTDVAVALYFCVPFNRRGQSSEAGFHPAPRPEAPPLDSAKRRAIGTHPFSFGIAKAPPLLGVPGAKPPGGLQGGALNSFPAIAGSTPAIGRPAGLVPQRDGDCFAPLAMTALWRAVHTGRNHDQL